MALQWKATVEPKVEVEARVHLVAAYRIPPYRRGDGTRYIPTVRTVRTVNVPSTSVNVHGTSDDTKKLLI